jgi:hypothetical protein
MTSTFFANFAFGAMLSHLWANDGHSDNGGFLIRLAIFAHLDNQSDSEKKQNAIRKPSARNDRIRSLFGSPP